MAAKQRERSNKDHFGNVRRENAEREAAAAEAVRLEHEVEHLKRDRERHGRKVEGARALGDEPFRIIVQGHHVEALGVSADVLVGQTLETGNQIAARVAAEVAEIDAEIKWREKRVAELLASAGVNA